MSLRYIGKDTQRPDAPAKAAGEAEYIHDLSRPNMLYGKVKFAGHAHAKILRIDTSKAERLPGVRAVITADNTPEVRIGFMRDNYALKGGKVRQQRDEVAAVAAIDPDIAAEAIALIEVEYEPLPAVFCPIEAAHQDAPRIHATDGRGRELRSNVLDLSYRHFSGDVAQGRRESKYIVEDAYSTPLIQQSCMGTAGCIAEFDRGNNLTIWAKTQIPFLAQRDFNHVQEALGHKGKNCRVVVPCLGGGFGTGLDTHCYEYIAILLAERTGKPVKMLYNREEEFAYLSPRQSSQVRVAQGCDPRGKLTFREFEVLLDNGAYTSWGATYPSVMLLPATSLYRVPNIAFVARLVYTNNTYCQAMRGYGNPELNWALESNLDDLAQAAGIDPLQLRLNNCNEPGETTPMGLKIRSCALRECLEGAGKRIGWADKRGKQKKKRRGVGLASLIHVGGSGRIYRSDASGIIMRMDDFGTVYVYSGAVEMGQGLHSALSLAVAESVGVTPDKVIINQTDTATCPWDVGTHASRGAFTACNAALMAAKTLHERLFAYAVEVLPKLIDQNIAKAKKRDPSFSPGDFKHRKEISADQLVLRDNVVYLKNAPSEPWFSVALGRVLRAIHFRPGGDMLTVSAFYDPPSELPDFENGRGNMSATYAYGTQSVEVEVDIETGDVTILKMVAVHDVGKVLNPQTLKGQTYGALAQGVGYALYEEVHTHEGKILNPGFTDYKIPTACEMGFDLDIEFIEPGDETGPFGAKGVGEPGLVPTAPAISNAIYDAIGVRILDLPITPEKIVAALKAKEAARA